jgi:hypothetical protein
MRVRWKNTAKKKRPPLQKKSFLTLRGNDIYYDDHKYNQGVGCISHVSHSLTSLLCEVLPLGRLELRVSHGKLETMNVIYMHSS